MVHSLPHLSYLGLAIVEMTVQSALQVVEDYTGVALLVYPISAELSQWFLLMAIFLLATMLVPMGFLYVVSRISLKPLQILLHPLRRRHVVLLLEGGVEDGFALEAGTLRDALNGDGQVSTFA